MKLIITFILAAFVICANGQDSSTPFFTNKEEAIAHAQNKGHKILMVFSGSDWCRPCIQFKKDILLNEHFQSFSQKSLTILYLDFPSKKKNKLSKEATAHNEELAELYNQSGSFPKLILTNSELEKIKEISFKNQSVEDFILSI